MGKGRSPGSPPPVIPEEERGEGSAHCGQVVPVTQMNSLVVPGYLQLTVPVPQAGQGEAMQALEVKNPVQVPATQTWSALQGLPQFPGWLEQWIGLDSS